MEKIILADGWVYQSQVGSHKHYKHPTKSGKVTIPFHGKDLPKRHWKIHFEKSVKKTLTIPTWLNTVALEQNINFSQVLQDALIEKVGIKH